MKKRLNIITIVCLLSIIFPLILSACDLGHSHTFGDWEIIEKATCAKNGKRVRVCEECGYEQTEITEKTNNHTFSSSTVTTQATCTTDGESTAKCSVCGKEVTTSIPALGHNPDSEGKCTRCGQYVIKMTSAEEKDANAVNTMTYSVSEYSSEIRINITFKDSSSYTLYAPANVDVQIVDANGKELYSKTLLKSSTNSYVSIDYSGITGCTTKTGTLYYSVYNTGYFSFKEKSVSLTQLPWTVDIELPTLPQSISYSSYSSNSACTVTDITYKVSDDDVTFYFAGVKTYDSKGSNYSADCKIGWKLYDSDNYVLGNGTLYTHSLATGEKFKNESVTVYNCIEPGQSYRLVIMNVN